MKGQLFTVLGIDPGSVITGFGVIRTDGVRSFHVAHGQVELGHSDFNERLGRIQRETVQLLDVWQPDEVAVEQVFMSNNAMSALKLGHARGAMIATVVAAEIPVHEYTARTIKQAVAGSGSADKQQVQMMVARILQIDEKIQNDAADGLAVAICHAHSRTLNAVAGIGVRRNTRRSRARSRARWTSLK